MAEPLSTEPIPLTRPVSSPSVEPGTETFVEDHDVIYGLRTAHQHQTQLLILADHKAHVLIGVVALILTILVSAVGIPPTVEKAWLIPCLAFVVLELIALGLAMLVIMPKTAAAVRSSRIEDLDNPLFFGQYTQFEETEFVKHLLAQVTENHSVRELMVRDLYQIGCVLKRKYRFLRFAYLVAGTGVLIVLGTTVAMLVQQV